MEIDGAVAELRKNTLRDDFRGHERDQLRPFKQIRIERGQIGRICDRQDRRFGLCARNSGGIATCSA